MNAPNLDMAALFPDRFVTGLYSAEEVNIARMAAVSIGKYIAAEYGGG